MKVGTYIRVGGWYLWYLCRDLLDYCCCIWYYNTAVQTVLERHTDIPGILPLNYFLVSAVVGSPCTCVGGQQVYHPLASLDVCCTYNIAAVYDEYMLLHPFTTSSVLYVDFSFTTAPGIIYGVLILRTIIIEGDDQQYLDTGELV